MIHVLDASAMIAYLRGEAGGQFVREILNDPSHICLAHALNLCEVYYDFHRSENAVVALSALQDLEAAGVVRREDISSGFCRAVGTLKATVRRISLADCFAVTLTHLVGGTLMSADHHEFDPLAASGACSVTFIR